MTDRPLALLRQAKRTTTAGTIKRSAETDIDKIFGEGYAKAHPELVAEYIACILALQVRCSLEALATLGGLGRSTLASLSKELQSIIDVLGNNKRKRE